ncbi:hypothetical protein FAI40_03425 [Acetobacteraceae bacterium]|nr:hypothetical protein FAI40_03425 [Acetobacteraceae bacterium]
MPKGVEALRKKRRGLVWESFSREEIHSRLGNALLKFFDKIHFLHKIALDKVIWTLVFCLICLGLGGAVLFFFVGGHMPEVSLFTMRVDTVG